MCVGYILASRASSIYRDEVTIDPMLPNKANDIFPLISTIMHSNVLILLYPVQPEMLVVISWYLYVLIKYYMN